MNISCIVRTNEFAVKVTKFFYDAFRKEARGASELGGGERGRERKGERKRGREKEGEREREVERGNVLTVTIFKTIQFMSSPTNPVCLVRYYIKFWYYRILQNTVPP